MGLRVIVLMAIVSSGVVAGDVQSHRDADTGWQVYTLTQGQTIAKVIPAAGCNLYSFRVDDVEYLRVPEELRLLPGVGFGTPLLYPTPNRIRGSRFEFQGREFRFTPNASGNFIHGLVHSVAWKVTGTSVTDEDATLEAQLTFEPGFVGFEQFPLRHRLDVSITVGDRAVQWTYTVNNSAGAQPIPFGFALHPYFLYQGDRAQTFLQVPATHWMEAEKQLPSGKLVPLEHTGFDLRKPMSLAGLQLDDVFFGMRPEQPVLVDFRDVGRKLTLESNAAFTHLVVYTPDRPFFCVENQTCATDAHNLASAGKHTAAHLQICPPGASLTGWVRFRVDTDH